MYTPDCNEAGHMISGREALLDLCLPNAFNTLGHLTPSAAGQPASELMNVSVCMCV